MEKQKFYLVAADALPEVFLRVAEAKRMLQVGEAATVGEAARLVGISRSAFYKYRDSVQPFNDMKTGRIITFYALLKDNPGVLSNVLSIFAGSGANILTINQSIPTNGCAAVTISAETSDMRESLEELIASAAETARPQAASTATENLLMLFLISTSSLWTLPVFFIVENPALRHRLRTREKLHLQAVKIVAYC